MTHPSGTNRLAIVIVADSEFNVHFANELAASFLGYANMSEVLGRSIAILEEDKFGSRHLYNTIDEFIKKGAQQKLICFKHRTGDMRKVLVYISKVKHDVRDRDDQYYYLVGLIDPNPLPES